MPKFSQLYGVISDLFQLGISAGTKTIRFFNSTTARGDLTWNPTALRTIIIPDKSGTLATLDDTAIGEDLRAKTSLYFYEDFLFGLGTLSSAIVSTGASVSSINTAAIDLGGRPGICVLSSGTTSAGQARLGFGTGDLANRILFGFGYWKTEILIQVPILATSTENFVTAAGYLDNSDTGAVVDGLFFLYTSSNPNWQYRVATNSTVTTVVTSVPVVAGQWYKLYIYINPDATLGEVYIDGVLVGSITSLPRGAGRQTGWAILLNKISGTLNRNVLIDYVEIFHKFATQR